MPTAKRKRIFVRSSDGSRTIISSRKNNFASRLCRRQRIDNLEQAQTHGLLPKFVDLEIIEREARRVLGKTSFDQEAERLVDSKEMAVARSAPTVSTSDDVRTALIKGEALRLRVDDMANVVEPSMDLHVRREISGRTLNVLTHAPFDVVQLQLPEDLEIYTDLVFASDVTTAQFANVSVYRGARFVGKASHFILRATSITGNLMPPVNPEGISLNEYVSTFNP